MTARPEALRVARRWITKADEDLAAAERLLSLDDSLAASDEARAAIAVSRRVRALVVQAVTAIGPSN